MTNLDLLFTSCVALIGLLARRPFQNFPLDDDFAIYTYRARFAQLGFRWKKDLQIIGIPIWRMLLTDWVHGRPEGGPQRVRILQTAFHVATSLIVYAAVTALTHNPWAALAAGSLHAFYGTSPDLTAGSFNHEQFYIPFVFAGFALLVSGPDFVFLAGLCFGFATIPKFTTGLYAAVLTPLVGYQFGPPALWPFVLGAAIPFLLSNGVDALLGFWDKTSRRQMRTRMATTLRLTRTKAMHFCVLAELRRIAMQTLPVWIAGTLGLALALGTGHAVWTAAFTGVTCAMIVCQRGFSRYHYLPLIGWFALLSGFAMDWILKADNTAATALFLVFAALAAWNVTRIFFFYRRPLAAETLAQYEKFDQYLYLPRVGKILKRWLRMRGESGQRIFVWGTFSQLYHDTGCPAADDFLHHCIQPWNDRALEGYFDGVFGGLIRHQPRTLIKTFPDLDVAALEEVAGLKYELVKVVLARFPVYRLKAVTSVAKNPLTLPWQEKMKILDRLTAGEWHAPAVDKTDCDRSRLNTALKECRKLIRINPTDIPGLIYLGELYARLHQPDRAAWVFETALRLETGSANVRLLLAKQYVQLGRFDEAAQRVQEETARFGENDEAVYVKGLILKRRGLHRAAVQEFEWFRTQHPARHDCWEALIESLLRLKEREQLKRLFAEAATTPHKPDREWLETRVANAIAALDAAQRLESATLDHYLNRDPENLLLLYAKASAFEREGDLENAYLLFKTVTERNSSHSKTRAAAWFRRARLSGPDQKKPFAEQCLRLDPSHSGARHLLIEAKEGSEATLTPNTRDDS